MLHARMAIRRFVFACCLMAAAGCAPLVVGGGAAGGYAMATDERTTGRQVDDATITTRVKAEMIGDADVKARDIDVDTQDGVVHLSGFVDSSRERERAETLARSVPGVRTVQNKLEVGSRSVGQVLDDKLLGSKIKANLIGEPGIRSLSVDVDVYRGVVHLTGVVETPAQKAKVLEIAKDAPGTRRVVDNLKIKAR